MTLGTITHVEETDRLEKHSEFRFSRVNAAEADFVILKSKHYRELIRVAADGRIARSAADTAKSILADLFEKCPAAVDVYFKIVRGPGRGKKNADV